MPTVTAAPMAMPAPIMAPNVGSAPSPITSAPSVAPGVPVAAPDAAPETTGAIHAPTPTAMIPGCPDGPDCPPEPEGLSDADQEMLKEFAKCEAEGKSLDRCLLMIRRRHTSASSSRRIVRSSRNVWGQAISRQRRSGGAGAWLGQTKMLTVFGTDRARHWVT